MPVRHSDAEWTGGLKQGKGVLVLGSGTFRGDYSFPSRFEDGKGTNPEELIAAAHAGCYSMALSAALEAANFTPKRIHSRAKVHFGLVEGRPTISRIELVAQAVVPGIDEESFRKIAAETKLACPVSRALAGTEIVAERDAGIRAAPGTTATFLRAGPSRSCHNALSALQGGEGGTRAAGG